MLRWSLQRSWNLQVTEEVAESHFTYDMAIHVMSAIGLILAGRTAEFKIATDWKLLNQPSKNFTTDGFLSVNEGEGE